LILLPIKPSFDQVAAGVSLFLSLKDRKNIQILSPSPMTVGFNRIIGVNKISQDAGNRNLVIKFIDYDANDIERVSYDIEDGQFKLTVIPKQQANPPLKEQIGLSYSGTLVENVILIGGLNESDFPSLAEKDFADINIIHIGTRDLSFSTNKPYISFSKPVSSISEVVVDLIKETGVDIDSDIATNLLMGIDDATQNLSVPNLKAETFSIVSELISVGGRRLGAQAPLRQEDYPAGSIPQQQWKIQNKQPTLQKEQQDEDFISREEKEEKPPQDWLAPKIYKGTPKT
jgi:hypothetical protein